MTAPRWAASAPHLAERIQAVYEREASFQADFVQVSTLKATGQATRAAGKVYFRKPGKMRWTYHFPVSQEIISDGKTLWVFQPHDNQVVISDAEKYLKSRASILFLAGAGKLASEFTVRDVPTPPDAPAGSTLELIPKEADPTVNRILIIADAKRGEVLETRVFDYLGNETRVRFSNPRFGRKLDDSLFSFQPPAGVDVIRQ